MHAAIAPVGSRPAFCGRGVKTGSVLCPVAAARALVIENAHKKGAGSTKNGRDSNSKSRGVKVYGGQPVNAGGIIVRQLGNKFHAGRNVSTGKDFTLFSLQDGIVVFETIKQKKCVSVYDEGHERTEGLQLKRQPGSRASRRLEQWRNTPRHA